MARRPRAPAGRALLARYGKLNVLVTISAAGKTIEKLAVRVLEPPKPKSAPGHGR